MLPDAVGTSFNIDWSPGTSQNVNVDYFYDNIYDEEEIRVVAFVQDDDNKEVYQAAIDNPYIIDGIEKNTFKNQNLFRIYPNPAKEYTNLTFTEPLEEDIRIEITDNSGRLVRIIKLASGVQLHSIYLSEYEPGLYFIRLINDKKLLDTRKLIILGNNW